MASVLRFIGEASGEQVYVRLTADGDPIFAMHYRGGALTADEIAERLNAATERLNDELRVVAKDQA